MPKPASKLPITEVSPAPELEEAHPPGVLPRVQTEDLG